MFPRVFLVVVSAFFLLGVDARGGVAPTDFVGIPWKTSLTDAKRIMTQRKDVRLKEETADHLVLEGGTFAEQPVEQWGLDFVAGKFCGATVSLRVPRKKDQGAAKIRDDEADYLVQSLSDKYGSVKQDTGNYHRRSRWEWQVTDPRSGERATVSVFLNFDWWHSEEYVVRYSYVSHSNPADAGMSTPPKHDL